MTNLAALIWAYAASAGRQRLVFCNCVVVIAAALCIGLLQGCTKAAAAPEPAAADAADLDADSAIAADGADALATDASTDGSAGTADAADALVDLAVDGEKAGCTTDESCKDFKVNADNCEKAVCDVESGLCEKGVADVGTKCDDGSPCTQNDSCGGAGTCVAGAAKICPDSSDKCAENNCDPSTGACKVKAINQGLACNDNDACTFDESCKDGKCSSPFVVACDDKNVCTADGCDPKKGCIFAALPGNATVVCDDGSACTVSDFCLGGQCVAKLKPGIDDGNACTQDKCDPTSGVTVHVSVSFGSCDDGDVCSKSDVCSKGQCAGVKLVCNDGNPCTDDFCDPLKQSGGVFGLCVTKNLAAGAPCDDGNLCTESDGCVVNNVGVAVCSGQVKDCDDKNSCTNELCQIGIGCLHIPVVGLCNDSDGCTSGDKCDGAVCKGLAKNCSDSDVCTNDSCDAKTGICTHDVFNGPCDDGTLCTKNDQCKGGICAGTIVSCDDGNPCTTDTCKADSGCKHIPVAGGTPCDDGLSCTFNEVCDAGKCTVLAKDDKCVPCSNDVQCKPYDDNNLCNGVVKCIASPKGSVCALDVKTPVKCDASKDNACTTNTCAPDTGACGLVSKNEGTPCAADKCVINPTCDKLGACSGMGPGCDDKNECSVDSCDKAKGCVYTNKADLSPCDDGSKCTPVDSCIGGVCTGGANPCKCGNDSDCAAFDDGDACNGLVKCLVSADPKVPGNYCQVAPNSAVSCLLLVNQPCKSNVCNKVSGICESKSNADGVLCSDGNLCTVGEVCAGGACGLGKKMDCDDKNACTDDVCVAEFGCLNGPSAPGALCNDGDDCTTSDTCVDGKCLGVKANCDDGNQCTLDLCYKVGGCMLGIDNSLPCEDGDGCTTKDTCKDGICVGGPLSCDDGNPCTVDACDGKGGCAYANVDGKGCDDSKSCTIEATCVAGKCVGKVKNCDDSNTCTDESCQKGVCIVQPAVGKPCSDSNLCTSDDACDLDGLCVGKVAVCKPGTLCEVVLGCDPGVGCKIGLQDNNKCSDNDACTLNDICKGGLCVGVLFSCDDKNLCTVDICDKNKGCVITLKECDDKNACTIDTCDNKGDCAHETVDGGACDDGDACTQKGKCATGVCASVAVVCNDKNACTVDSCDPKIGCVYTASDDPAVKCDDGNPCTDDSCAAGKCLVSPKNCDDGNPCTIDSCDLVKGCVTVDSPDKAMCDDGDQCTADSKCSGGVCLPGWESCPICKTDKDCALIDDNNLCNGAYSCSLTKATGKMQCYFNPTPVKCDSTGDTACFKNKCEPLTGQCGVTQLVNGSKCEDGKGCTINDSCNNGLCAAGQVNDCAAAKDACNDAKCVEDNVQPKGFSCIALPKANSTLCDADSNGCTANDVCTDGVCTAGSAVKCPSGACQIGVCKSAGVNGFTCDVAVVVDQTPCDDGQLCTVGDVCKAGACVAGKKPYDCSALTKICATSTCDKTANGGTGDCVPKAQNEGKICDSDNNGCTVDDKCIAGACVPGGPPDCSALTDGCAIGACKSTGGVGFNCIVAAKPDQLPCEADNNGCTVGDACKGGTCAAGLLKDCSALTSKDGCMVGTCKSLGDSANSCSAVPAPLAQPCDADGNGCTNGDACNKDGSCVPGAAIDCLAFSGSCTTGSCKSKGASAYVCDGVAKADGTACDADLSGCTVNDKCAAGKCIAGKGADCGKDPGACLAPVCIAAGSDKFQCDPKAKADDTGCDADGNGCTANDSCQAGVCEKGELQTCSDLASMCSTVKCDSTGTNAFACKITPKVAWPPLIPPPACVSTDVPDKCPNGFYCYEVEKLSKKGICLPTVTVFCDDKDKCTSGDACFNGKCLPGQQVDCDDKDPCTSDSCSQGKCSNKVIPACVTCLHENFDSLFPKGWLGFSEAWDYVVWTISPKKPFGVGASNLHAEWPGLGNVPAQLTAAKYVYRQMFIDKGGAPQLDFYLNMKVSNQNCTGDDLFIYVNGAKIWQKCDNTDPQKLFIGSVYEHIAIDLAAYAGAPITLEFRVIAGVADKNIGSIDIDNVRITGACGTACLGVDVELHAEPDPLNPEPLSLVVPDFMIPTDSDAGYATWKPFGNAAHTGANEMRCAYTGKPLNGLKQTASMTFPLLRPVAGDKLRFALRAQDVVDEACGADDFTVTLGGKEIYSKCDKQLTWKEEIVDLTPFANQTLDLTFTVTTGAQVTTQAVWELDDISVGGAPKAGCQYGCFVEHFDTVGISKWTASSSDPLFKTWVSSQAASVSPKNSAFATAQGPNLFKAWAYIMLIRKAPFGQFGPMGGTFSFNYNLFVEKEDCDTPNLANPVFLARLHSSWSNGGKTFIDMMNDKDTPNHTYAAPCKSSGGWTGIVDKVSQFEVVPSQFGYPLRPTFYFRHMKDAGLVKLYVDDVVFMCR